MTNGNLGMLSGVWVCDFVSVHAICNVTFRISISHKIRLLLLKELVLKQKSDILGNMNSLWLFRIR